MDLMGMTLGIVLGSLVTSVLIWSQRGTTRQDVPPGYFSRVAQSVVITALLAGMARMALDYATTGGITIAGAWFAGGWLLGGLLAGWFLVGRMQRQ